MTFNVLVLPAVIGFLLKVWVLYITRTHAVRDLLFYSLLCVFALQNLWEIIGFFEKDTGIPMQWYFRTYYVLLIAVTAFLVIYALKVARISRTSFVFYSVIWAVASISLAFAILFTDLVVAGYKPAAYTLTAIQGPLYVLFRLFTLGTIVTVISALIYGYRTSSTRRAEIQNLYFLLALAPLILVSLLVTALLMLGISFNMAVVFPLATTLFVLILALSETEHGITDIRIYLPFSAERQLVTRLTKSGALFSIRKRSLKQTSDDIEKALLLYSLSKNEYRVSAAAKDMGVNRTTLYSICRRHEVDVEALAKKSGLQ